MRSLAPFVTSSAEITCLLRAKSFNEKKALFKTDDFVAVLISNTFTSFSSKMVKAFSFGSDILGLGAPAGVYEYIVARTRYIDNIFRSLPKKFKQVFIIGAGFDSRACRFQQELAKTKIYECDHPNLQLKKKAIFEELDIPLPANMTFIPIDFTENNLGESLKRCLIPPGETSLFVLEGLLCYLDELQVTALFSAIAQHAGPQSEIVFDYVHTDALTDDFNGGETLQYIDNNDDWSRHWTFGFSPGEVSVFLEKCHFSLIEDIDSQAMERLLLADTHEHDPVHILRSQSLVRAKKNNYQ